MKHLFYYLLLFSFFACRKEPSQSNQSQAVPKYIADNKALSEITFDCDNSNKGVVESYFIGKLNGKDICYYDGVANYERFEGLIDIVISNKPTFTINDTSASVRYVKQLWLGFGLSAKKAKTHSFTIVSAISKDTTLKTYIENHFKEGGSYLLLDRTNSGGEPYEKIDGFEIILGGQGTDSYFELSSAFGTQSSKSFFKVKSMKKGAIAGQRYYDLEFDMRCELFKFRLQEDKDALYGLLEGTYYTRLVY